MKKIKSWFIHCLGGLTVEESKASDHAGWEQGVYITLISLRVFADRMNGISADEWCKRMYNHINDQIKTMEGGVRHESEGA